MGNLRFPRIWEHLFPQGHHVAGVKPDPPDDKEYRRKSQRIQLAVSPCLIITAALSRVITDRPL